MYASENFQIMNYGLGGKISGHADATGGSTEEVIKQGDRGMQCLQHFFVYVFNTIDNHNPLYF